MEHVGKLSSTPAADQYFVKPLADSISLRKTARKLASSTTLKVGVVSGAVGIGVSLIGSLDFPSTISYTTIIFAFLAVVTATGLTQVLLTNANLSHLSTKNVTAARRLLYESLRRIENSKACRLEVIAILEECESLIKKSETEFKAGRFTTFWDRIEQVANKLAELKNVINILRSLQNEYETKLRGYMHNLPALLPGCGSITADITMIERYSELLQRAQADINFALIWEHRQTRAIMTAGFSTLGEMVQNVGNSVQNSLTQLIAIESAPRYYVGISRQ